MKKILSIILTIVISTSSSLAGVPNTFVSGEIATAAKFNENFGSLSNEIDDVKTTISNISSGSGNASGGSSSDGSVIAQVNGIDMRVSSSQLGRYSITTPTGKTISIDAEGYPIISSIIVYESNDCTGQAYVGRHQLNEYIVKSAGHVFANPKLSTSIDLVFSDGNIGYSLNDTLTKINYKSYKQSSGGATLSECFYSRSTDLASKVLPNDPAITGVNSVPLIITGVGSDLKISPIEIGAPVTGLFSVYANGTKIGTTTRYPGSISDYVEVRLLNDYHSIYTSIYLYKDGSYSVRGVRTWTSSATLYYKLADCSGTAYYFLADDADKEWLDTSSLSSKRTIINQGNYYNLSSQAYRVSQPFLGRKYNSSDTCENRTTDGSNKVYLQATFTSTIIPIPTTFTPPITIEGYTEPTPYNSLPVAF